MRLCRHARCSGLATFSTARSCSTTARFSHGRNSLAARPPPGTLALTHAALASSIISESSYGRNSGWVTISATSRMTPPLSAALLRSRAPRITLICSGRLLERVTRHASRVTRHASRVMCPHLATQCAAVRMMTGLQESSTAPHPSQLRSARRIPTWHSNTSGSGT